MRREGDGMGGNGLPLMRGSRRKNGDDERPNPFAGLVGSRAGRIGSGVREGIDAHGRVLHKEGRKGAAQWF
jgi:hypothetical protein